MILIGCKGYTLCLVFFWQRRIYNSTRSRSSSRSCSKHSDFPRCCSSGGPSSGKLGGGFLLALSGLSSLEEFQFVATFDAGPILAIFSRGTTGVDDSLTEPWLIDV